MAEVADDLEEFMATPAVLGLQHDNLCAMELGFNHDAVVPIYTLVGHMNSLTNLSTLITAGVRQSHPKQVGFSLHLEQKSDLDFFRNLRVTKSTFYFLIEKITEHHAPIFSGGHIPVTIKESLMMCLWYLGSKQSYREIAELFGLSEGGVFKCVQIILKIICNFGNDFLVWPAGDRQDVVEREFKSICGFPGVIGAVDGCHIDIKAPTDVQSDFLDRTNRHSINLMAVCDSRKKFTFINVGFPGSAHDSRVFKSTELYNRMLNSPEDLFSSNYYHLVGDSAFQMSNYMLIPFKDFGNLDNKKKQYNKKLSQTRCVIENAFGFLKGRFRRLKYVDAHIARIPLIITACCILHNITLEFACEEEILISDGLDLPHIELDIGNDPINLPDIGGAEKRHFIVTIL